MRTQRSHCHGPVQSLAGELRSRKPLSAAKRPKKTKRNIKTIFQMSWNVKRFLNHSAYKEQVPDPKPAESHVQASDPLSHQRQDGISLPLNSFPASSRMAAGGWHRCPDHLTRCLRGTRAATVTHHFLPPQHRAHGQGPGFCPVFGKGCGIIASRW